MSQSAWTRSGEPFDASELSGEAWEELKRCSQLGEFVMTCCQAPAVLKTSINGVAFFAHLSDQCDTAPETIWHKNGKAAVLAALTSFGIVGREEVSGSSSDGKPWKADVLFSYQGRTIAIELQRSYQHLRDFIKRQERYSASGIECYWLVRQDVFITLTKATTRLLLKREFDNVFPLEGIGTGSLPELPVSLLETEPRQLVHYGLGKGGTVAHWLTGILNKSFRYCEGSWNQG